MATQRGATRGSEEQIKGFISRLAMIEYAEHFADRTLKRTLVRLLGHVPTPTEERQRTEIVQCAGPQGRCSEYRLDGRPLFQHRLTRTGGEVCSDVINHCH